jgi:hypothetical protein
MRFISTRAHTIMGLIVGVVLVFAPVIFGFTDNQAATIVPIAVGIFIILNELITTSPASPLKLIPMRVHILLDVITGALLAFSPWLFGFFNTDEPLQWLPHVIVGIMVVGYALLTNTSDESRSTIA